MSSALWFSLVGAALVAIALYGVFAEHHPLRRLIALNMMASGVFLVLIGLARQLPGRVPDPVPHAMVLTGIVVAVSATAFALALLRRLSRVQQEEG
ncbi:MAG: NADH-quinone oxidoreductase subunit K [Gammaproteobacteria bacterium]|nr:NADH-quinone oxidoreductase subunit K [Gammaproteobacteria bacterium]MCW8841581.1 NADH-quinone oxidoreductase subunit K [Gammaproteobacteria bacterium]MCW8927571.1 NADH-quinone oxidoreductase subunit K [Gammaproteobacteria bacterium]MCW8958291.1 NADH-quinone oxidoreductase subunit K [Gammaproteobacteria bacterium]MCW8972902.1 NADH-quinone oxidoreductase subunit K [Gammaproteobacteria bacterium]